MNRVLSPDCYLGVIFNNPKTSLWPQVRAILEESASFIDTLPDGTVLAGFTTEKALAGVQVFRIAEGWKKTAAFFLRGKPIKSLFTHQWYSCYLGALQCGQSVAYCQETRFVEGDDETGINGTMRISIDPAPNSTLTCTVPCCKVFFAWRRGEPATIIKQFWARAAKEGYTHCPLFNIDAFKVAGDVGERKFTLIEAPVATK